MSGDMFCDPNIGGNQPNVNCVVHAQLQLVTAIYHSSNKGIKLEVRANCIPIDIGVGPNLWRNPRTLHRFGPTGDRLSLKASYLIYS